MKTIIGIFLFVLSSSCFAQELNQLKAELESLELEKLNIEKRLYDLDYMISQVKDKIEQETLKHSLNNGFICNTKTIASAKLKQSPSYSGKIIEVIPKKKSVTVIEYAGNDYWKVSYENKIGFLNEVTIQEQQDMIIAKKAKKQNDKQLEIQKKKEQEQRSKEIKAKQLEDLKERYGSYAYSIMNGRVTIGMDKEMVVKSIGQPNDKNISRGSWGIHEQWVYEKKDTYVYFENGKVTSIQE